MHDPGTYSSKQTLNKWLIAVVMLVSVFSLSGLSSSLQAAPSPVQTSWMIRGSKSAVNSIHFSTNRPNLSKQNNVEFADYSIVNLCLLHDKTYAVKLKRWQNPDLVCSYQMLIAISKTIPQNGKAEPAHSLV